MKHFFPNILLCFFLFNLTLANSHPLDIPPKKPSLYSKISLYIHNLEGYFAGRQPVIRHDLPPCFVADEAIESEWGERNVAAKWTKGLCHSVLEFGGGAGSVSAVIQMNLENKKDHIVIQPDEKEMFGGIKILLKNKESCKMAFTAIDHVLAKGEGKALLEQVSQPFDCIIADCENCLVGEYEKNPELFDHIQYIQVERDDRLPLNASEGPYDSLFIKLNMKKIGSGVGCNGECETEVWGR